MLGNGKNYGTWRWQLYQLISAFGTVTKGLLKGLGGQVETIQTTALWRTARILRRVLETWGDCYHSNSSEKPSANADVKNSNE